MRPITVAAGALACIVAAGGAQAAPALGITLSKLANVTPATALLEQV